MKIKNSIPNLLTCFNLVSGCIAVVMALRGEISWATFWIIIAAVFDFSDGFAARILKAYSPMGKELDSLADMVSFGLAPGMIVFWMLEQLCSGGCLGFAGNYIPYLGFIIPTFSGLRLAKFNIDTRQTTSFIGMPVPAHALFWSSIGYSFQYSLPVGNMFFLSVLVVISIITSLLLVSEVPMFSLKVKSLAWKGNELRYVLIIGAILLIAFFGVLGIAGAIVLYIVLSFFNKRV